MYLKRLRLSYFRNYSRQEVEFTAPKNILVGPNAQGKSNLLEAVQLLIALRSHRGGRDRDLVMTGMESAEIWADCQGQLSGVELTLKLRHQGRRSLLINGVNVARQADFLGYMSGVLFTSLDLDLVRGSPEQRRSWLDGVLVQLEPIYFGLIQNYHQVLRQRNALLKAMRQGQMGQTGQLELWNQQLASHGTHILRRRSRLIERLSPLASHWHEQISTGEQLQVSYLSKLEFNSGQSSSEIQQMFLTKLDQVLMGETAQGTSLVGPHRDDLEFTINGKPAKEYGSQGQQRTLVLALKLAELELIQTILGEPPLLLLDDVLAELDLQRQDQLLSSISADVQTIITTTHLGSFDPRWLNAAQIFQVEQGKVSK